MLGGIGGRRKRGWQRMRWLDGITDWWTWVWVNSRSWWWNGRPGVLQSWGRKDSDTIERLNWTELHRTTVLFSIWVCLLLPGSTSRKFSLTPPSQLRLDYKSAGMTGSYTLPHWVTPGPPWLAVAWKHSAMCQTESGCEALTSFTKGTSLSHFLGSYDPIYLS